MQPGCSTMLELQSSLLLCIFFACLPPFSIADTQEVRKTLPESGTRTTESLGRLQKDFPSHHFWWDDQMRNDAGAQRPDGEHRLAQLIASVGPRHSGKLDDLERNPQIDLGPHRPSGQDSPSGNIRLTPLEILSEQKLGQRLSNSNRRDFEIGLHRPRGQDPVPDMGPQRSSELSPSDESVFLGKLSFPGVDVSGNPVTAQRTSGMAFSRYQPSNVDRDIGAQRPNGQIPPSIDLGSQRRDLQNPLDKDERDLFVSSDSFDGRKLERFRRDLETQNPGKQEPCNSELMLPISADTFVEDDSTDNDIEVSPYPIILKFKSFASRSKEHDSDWINAGKSQDLGPHRPMGSVDPNGLPSPPTDLGPQRPSGQSPPSTTDLGPQRPSGQHPPVESTPAVTHYRPVGVGPHRPSGAADPNDVPSPPSDLGPHRTSGQHQPSTRSPRGLVMGPHRPSGAIGPNDLSSSASDLRPPGTSEHPLTTSKSQLSLLLHSPPSDLGPQILPPEDMGSQRPVPQKIVLADPSEVAFQSVFVSQLTPSDFESRRPNRATDPEGSRLPFIDLGPHRPSGQNPPPEYLGPRGPSGQHPPPHDLGPQRPSGQHPPSDLGPQRPAEQHPPTTDESVVLADSHQDASQKVVVSRSNPSDLGPRRPSGATDPNGLSSSPIDLGPHRPSGQHPPPDDRGPHRPSGQHPPPDDLGPQRPAGQHPPTTAESVVLADSHQDASQKVVVFRSNPSDLGPRRPSGATDPNGLPSSPIDLGPHRPSGQHPPPDDRGPQRPSGQHPPPDDLGPQRPAGQHPPTTAESVVLADPLQEASPKVVVSRSTPSDLGPHRPSGATDPNGIPSSPIDLGPHRPSGQHPPLDDLGPERPSGQHTPGTAQSVVLADPVEEASEKVVFVRSPSTYYGDKQPYLYRPLDDLGSQIPSEASDPSGLRYAPNDLGPQRPQGQYLPSTGDLGPHRPSGQHPPESEQKVILADPVEDTSLKLKFHRPPGYLGPHRPSGATDPNGIATPPSDLSPHRPSGQHPPHEDDPLRIEFAFPLPSVDLGPHRPAGQTDPNIKPTPEYDVEQASHNVYWNVPTFMCHKHGYPFRNLSGEYGVVQNPNDAFRGQRITILYDPGLFPAVLQDEKGKKFLRNGGVPQEGDIQKHIAALEDSIEEQVPEDFDGLGVIDFEAWRPVWAQNWGTLNIYRTVSLDLEKRRDPTATRRAWEIRARARFEAAAREFFEATVQLAQQLRPRGRWGFYGFPHCFNQVPARPGDYTCATQHQHQNDKIDWLWKASTALYPSVYLTKANKTAQDELAFVSGRLTEAQRVSKGVPVFAYIWYRYHDTGEVLTEDDLWSCLSMPRRLNLAGTILWGSSSDLNSRDKCARFSQILQTSIGPAVARAAGRRVKKTSLLPSVIFAT